MRKALNNMSKRMEMPIITAFETRASGEFYRLIQGIITLRTRN